MTNNMTVSAPTTLPALEATDLLPMDWGPGKLLALMQDVAYNMYDLPFILKKHKLSRANYDVLSSDKYFQTVVEQMTKEWNAPGNTQKRVAQEALIGIEGALPDLIARLSKANEPLPGVVSLLKTLAEISGQTGTGAAVARSDAPTERFKIVINMGTESKSFDKAIQIEATNEQATNTPGVT